VKATAVGTRFHKLKSLNSEHPRLVQALLEKESTDLGHHREQPQTDENTSAGHPSAAG